MKSSTQEAGIYHWSESYPAEVTVTAAATDISVSWTDTTYTYTANSNPTGTEVNIILRYPGRGGQQGPQYPSGPTTIATGEVVWHISNAQLGEWEVDLFYIDSVELDVTIGVTNE